MAGPAVLAGGWWSRWPALFGVRGRLVSVALAGSRVCQRGRARWRGLLGVGRRGEQSAGQCVSYKDTRTDSLRGHVDIDGEQHHIASRIFHTLRYSQKNFDNIITQNILNWRFDVCNDEVKDAVSFNFCKYGTTNSCLKRHTIPELMILPFEEHYPPHQTLSGDNDNSCCSIM